MAVGDPSAQAADGVCSRLPSNNAFEDDPKVWDLVIVGAGVAGSALAYAQGKNGRRVLLLERDLSVPDRIVGELLQPGGYLALKKLGLTEAVKEIDAQKIYGYCIFKEGRELLVNYPLDSLSDDVAGRSFHNGRFVQRMRQAAAALPSVTVREGIGKMLVNDSEVDSDVDSELELLKYWVVGLNPKLQRYQTTFLFQYLRTTVAPELPESVQSAFLAAVEAGDIRAVRNKQMLAVQTFQPGALMLGDAFNMRHPLTGGGMTVALSDCRLLSDMLQPFPDFTDSVKVAERTSELLLARKPVSATINTLAGALYQVFCYEGEGVHEEMRQAAFDYLSQGGTCAQGPVSLLSGLNPQPLHLVTHFFSVALFGVGRLLWPPSPWGAWMSLKLLLHATGIILPILRDEGLNMFLASPPS
eukprot:evm.model.scf_4173.1 EVM.evm.TU.scf_4173.1   scf_4173:1970-8011(-)